MKREHALIYLSPALLAAGLVGTVLYLRDVRREPEVGEFGESTYREVMEIVEREYVDGVSREELLYGAVRGMLETLDPHSRGYSPDEWAAFRTNSEGRNPGIGIRFGRLGGRPTVLRVIPGSPAERAGLETGDRLLSVDGEPLDPAIRPRQVKHLITGPSGTKVTFDVRSWAGEATRTVVVERGAYKIETVVAREARDGIAYLRVESFNHETGDDFRSRLGELIKASPSPRGLIVDLRGNRGGSLDSALDIVGCFLEADRVLTVVRRERADIYPTEGDVLVPTLPLCVLVDGESASASEVVAGALQDYKRAMVIGEQTWGKGVVQNVIPLRTAPTGIKLTTSRYYTPSGRGLQRQTHDASQILERGGIIPDVTVEVGPDERDRIRESWRFHDIDDWLVALMREDDSFRDHPFDEPDPQLDAATACVQGYVAPRILDRP